MINKDMVGKAFPSIKYVVTREKIIELIQAIGEPNPLYYDQETAKTEGYPDIVAPPTFVTLAGYWTGASYKILRELGVTPPIALHGEEEYEYGVEIHPGDILTGESRLLSIEEKHGKSGPMELVRIETAYTNQRGEQVVRVTSLTVVKRERGEKI